MENYCYNHHRRSIRLQGYDYSRPGAYFITVCAQDHICLFGEIMDDKMILNDNGKIVYDEWLKTAQIRNEIKLGKLVVMPNHIHGIMIIARRVNNKYSETTQGNAVDCNHESKRCGGPGCRGVLQYAPTEYAQKSSKTPNVNTGNTKMTHKNNPKFRSPSQTIGAIVRGFKSAATKQINRKRKTPGAKLWQRNYWEHIIRNRNEYYRICNYIENNPRNWQTDRFRSVMEKGVSYEEETFQTPRSYCKY